MATPCLEERDRNIRNNTASEIMFSNRFHSKLSGQEKPSSERWEVKKNFMKTCRAGDVTPRPAQ